MGIYRSFISLSNKRKIRKDVLYQVITEDICDVFQADDSIRETFRLLIEGKDVQFGNKKVIADER